MCVSALLTSLRLRADSRLTVKRRKEGPPPGSNRRQRRLLTPVGKPATHLSLRFKALLRVIDLETEKHTGISTPPGDPDPQAALPTSGRRTGSPTPTGPLPDQTIMATGGEESHTVNIGDSTITIHKSGAIPKRTMDRDGFELSKKPCRPVEHKPSPVKTGNFFTPLSMDVVTQPGPSSAPQAQTAPQATTTAAAPQATQKRMPPIIVRVPVVESSLLAKLKAAGPTCYFEYVKNGLRVMTKSHQDHAAVSKFLQLTKTEFFTYNPTPGATVKFVLRGLPPNATCEEIATELKNCGIAIQHVKQITKGRINAETREKTLIPLALWILTIEKTLENIGNLKALTGICNFRIRIEDYRAPKRQLQCFRCQNHGHRAEYCNLKQRCVKCAGDHAAKECTMNPRTTAKCANCQGDHPASSKQCPAAQKYRERKTRIQAAPAPNLNSNRDFPALPSRPAPPGSSSTE